MHSQIACSIALALALVFLASAHPVSAASPLPIGAVTELSGQAVAVLEGKRRELAPQAKVHRGETLRTYHESSLEVRFEDGSLLSMDANAAMVLDKYAYTPGDEDSNLLFRMISGFVRMVTGAIVKQNPDNFRFQTPLASLGVRGTEFFAHIKQDGEDIGVYQLDPEHAVAVSTEKDSLLIQEEGYYTHVALDGTLSPLSRIQQNMIRSFGRSQRRMQQMRVRPRHN